MRRRANTTGFRHEIVAGAKFVVEMIDATTNARNIENVWMGRWWLRRRG